MNPQSCCWYHKGTIFQANHNRCYINHFTFIVVVDTTKVQFFKQITTTVIIQSSCPVLLLIPQRYNFSSKSQRKVDGRWQSGRCCWYHKGTIFQANHNGATSRRWCRCVVVDTTKVQFFKQITTGPLRSGCYWWLLLIPQRYNFSSKSQRSKGR